jgi:hypothetical protein
MSTQQTAQNFGPSLRLELVVAVAAAHNSCQDQPAPPLVGRRGSLLREQLNRGMQHLRNEGTRNADAPTASRGHPRKSRLARFTSPNGEAIAVISAAS